MHIHFLHFKQLQEYLKKVRLDQVNIMILIAPSAPKLAGPALVPRVASVFEVIPFLNSQKENLLKNALDQIHSLLQNKTLTFAVCAITGYNYARKVFFSYYTCIRFMKEEFIIKLQVVLEEVVRNLFISALYMQFFQQIVWMRDINVGL